ncbi:DUF3857 domain-containing protein [Pedobacter heparinus]|uniref:DUF3857 domain-containing protein n=1 Tax=Pedobacter heparinus TaxID=984 RepID=UPI0029303CC5|nr:DUF3857 domain-containing protein [Pedobacter heparinus]
MQAPSFFSTLLQVLFKKMLFLAFFILITIHGYGQAKNFYIDKRDPAWIVKLNSKGLKPAAKDISDGYFLAVYENQNHVELQEEYTHVIREIVSDAGVQNGSQISVTYDPSFQKLVFHNITLWRGNAPSNRMQAGKFKVLQNEKDLSKFIYSGTYDAFLLLDDVRKGDRIEFSYTIKGTNPIFGDKFASLFYFEGSSSIGHTYTNVIFNKSRSFNLKNFNFNDQPKITERNGLKVYEWEHKLTKTHRITDFEPSWYNPLKRSQLTEYKSWNDVVNWGLSVNDYTNMETPLLDKKVKELEDKAGGNQVEYIECAIRFVQDEIRYMGIEMGVYSHRPNAPEKVLKQRYGDCKDKSLLLVYLLKAKNIPAYMAYVDTYSTVKTKDYLPSPFVFNHVVVLIEYRNNKTWVDPTIAYQRGSFNSLYFPDYGDALILKKGVNALESVISIPTGKLVSELKFDVADTVPNSKSLLTIKSTYTDNYADNIRSEIAESGTDGMEKTYLEYYGKYYPDIESKAQIKVSDNEETNTLEIVETYEINNIWAEDKETAERYLSFFGDLISSEMRDVTAKNRLAPMSLKNPVNVEQVITVNMPYLFNFGTESVKIENDDYYFELYRFQRGKTVTFNYTFRNMNAFIEGSKVKDYVKNKSKITDHLTYYINRGTTAEGEINPYMLSIFIAAMMISAYFYFKLYHKSGSFDLERLKYAQPIGGWLVLLGIRVVILPLVLLSDAVRSGLFSMSSWTSLDTLKYPVQYLIKLLYFAEVTAFALLIGYAVLLVFLFFKKRESFPRLFIIFSICLLAFLIGDNVAAIYIRSVTNQSLINMEDIPTAVLSLLYSFAWIAYVTKAERVKETFVYTYPEVEWKTALIGHYNEKMAVQKESVQQTELINSQVSIKNYEDI